MNALRTSLLLVASISLACSRKDPEPVSNDRPTATTTTSSATASTSGAHATVTASANLAAAAALPAKLDWTAPPKLKEEPGQKPMRIATYHPPKVAGDTEEPTLVVSHAGGSLDANVERWVGQFTPVTKKSRTDRAIGAIQATIVEVHGSYGGGMGGGGGGDKQMLLGAIVPVADGAYFFKMTGPEASVEAARADFDALVGSLKALP